MRQRADGGQYKLISRTLVNLDGRIGTEKSSVGELKVEYLGKTGEMQDAKKQ